MKKFAITGDSGEPIATPSVCSKCWPLKQKYVEVSTNLNNAKMSSVKWWLRRESESSTGTLVKRDITSKLTIRSLGCTCILSRICMKRLEFLTWWVELPVSWLRKPVNRLASWYVGAPMLLTSWQADKLEIKNKLYWDARSTKYQNLVVFTFQ